MEGIAVEGEFAGPALIDLRLIGFIRARTPDHPDILPSLRKARALFVLLALTDGQSATRRWLASLLWSRSDPAQGLARLRDTLSTLRHALRTSFETADILTVTADRVSLRPGRVRVDFDDLSEPAQYACLQPEIATDLDGIDPALDAWLLGLRGRFRAKATAGDAALSTIGTKASRGVAIGVASFHVVGSGPASEMAFPLAEELATSLSRIRGVSVVSAARSGSPEIGLDFTLEGSLQMFGSRLRIVIKLLEAPSSIVCWSQHFDYDHDDILHIQQDVAALVAAGLEPELPHIAGERLRRLGIEGNGAYCHMLRAISLIHQLDRKSFNEAGELLSRIIDTEPEYSSAYSWLALWHIFLVGQGWARDARASTARAGEVAEQAVMLDPNDARGLTIAGHVRAFLHRRLDEALPLHERALAINPSLSLAWNLSGVAHAYKGNLEEARHRIDHCRHLAPRDPHIFFADGTFCLVELLSRQHEMAVDVGRKVTQLQPRFSAAFKPYLSALGHLGQEREAVLVHRRLLQLEPDFNLRSFRSTAPFARREHMEHYARGLSQAGVV